MRRPAAPQLFLALGRESREVQPGGSDRAGQGMR